ncbi:MAG TPA: glycosyltransferase family 4 protein [Steroidobacteraceae bacterium]|nr:glycosyltransferase family 4 protein [Steroidobacteraceae bacterium]
MIAQKPVTPPHVCIVGLGNLPVLAPEYSNRPAGGEELQHTLLARALVRRGWRVSMVVADHGQADGATWDEVKTYKAYRPDEGLPVVRFLHPRWTKLHNALQRADADVYYTSCAGAQLAQVVLFAHRHGRKVAFRVASDSDCDPRSLLVRYWRDRQLYRWGLERADLVLVQTLPQQRTLADNFGRQSRVAGPIVEPAGRRPAFSERDIDALWVANLRALKRPQLFLDAAARLPRLTFHMAGARAPGEEAVYEEARIRAESLPNVTFHGFVPQHRIGALFERARVHVSTSDVDGFPNTFLQAWSRGTPVVTFLDPGNIVSSNGMGAAVSDAGELSAAIARLAQDPADWQARSSSSARYFDEQLNESRTVSVYLQALSALLAPPPAASVVLGA